MITNNIDLSMIPTAKNGHGVDANFDSIDVKTARRIAKARSKHYGGFLYSSIEDEATRLLFSHVLGNIELKYVPASSSRMKNLENYIIGRYQGPEIKLGDTKVPKGGSLRWIFAEIL